MQEPVAELKGLFAPLSPQPLVSVIMTMFNSEATLEAGVRSLLAQTYGNIEVILSDDGSTDGTLDIARRLCAEDGRVRLLQFGGNHGTYWAKNFGLAQCRGELVTFADSDDTSDIRRIELQVDALRSPGVAVSTCAYSRVDELGVELPIPGSRGFAFISQMIRRDVLKIIGFFDSVRTSADDEMLNRILIAFGLDSHVIVSERLYTAVVREGSLSHNKDNPRYSPVTRGLSPPRRAYAEGFRAWHARVLAEGAIPYIPFPVTNRPFPVDPKLAVKVGLYDSNFISVVAFGSPARSEAALLALARQCEHATSCRRSWHHESALEGGRWKIHLVANAGEATELARSGEGFPAGYVVFCDLAEGVPDDFIQQAVTRVERGGRRAPLESVDGTGESGVPVVPLHGAGGHTENTKYAASQRGGREAAAKGVPAAKTRPAAARTGAAAGQPAVAPATGQVEAPRRPGKVSRIARDLAALGGQFARLWSRSEQAIALMLAAGVAVFLSGLLLRWPWLSGLGTLGMLGAVGVSVLMSTRRARLLADPEHRVDSFQQVSSLKRGLNAFRQTHLGRGPALLARDMQPVADVAGAGQATAEAADALATVVVDAPSEVAAAIRSVTTMPPAAGLAQLSGIEDRYMIAPSARGAIGALRVVLLAQAGRTSLAMVQIDRLESDAAGPRSRQWAERARRLVNDPAPAAVASLVEDVVGRLQEGA